LKGERIPETADRKKVEPDSGSGGDRVGRQEGKKVGR
jgi:hypothetical protein